MIQGGDGIDIVLAGRGDDTVDTGGGLGNLVIGGRGDDDLQGGTGIDILVGGTLHDLLPDEGTRDRADAVSTDVVNLVDADKALVPDVED